MKSADATRRVQLDVECPECGEWQDIFVQCAEQEYPSNIGETRDFREEQFIVECHKCKNQFYINRTEY